MRVRLLSSIVTVLMWTTAAAAQAPTDQASQSLLGATVETRDGELVGAVDQLIAQDGKAQMLVIGLAGYLGAGEKDVLVPSTGIERLTTPNASPRHFNLGVYGGGGLARIRLPMTLKEVTSAPAYVAKDEKTGAPSSHVGTPAESKDKPPSSTQSGGPG